MWLLIDAGIKVNPCLQKGSQDISCHGTTCIGCVREMGPNYSTGNQNHTYHPCSWWMNDKRSPMAFLETTIQVTFSDATCMPHLQEFLQILSFGDVPPPTLEFWLKVKGKINPNHLDKLEQGSHRQASKNFNDFSMIFQDKNPKFPW